MAKFKQSQVENLVLDLGNKALKSITLTAGTGLTGGGTLAANRTFALTGQALAVHNATGAGFLALNGSGAANTRTLSGSARISVSNGDGGGNVAIDLQAIGGLSAGTATKVTYDVYGRITSATSPTTLAGYGITDAIGGSGGTINGALGFDNAMSVGLPVLNAASSGLRLLMRQTRAAGAADFAIGYNTDRLWLGISQAISGQDIAFYAGATMLAKFAGDGVATFYGQIRGTTKSFLIPHPTKRGWELEHGSLEGPEHAVFFRGRCTGKTRIDLPAYWKKLVHADSITVHLTARNGNRYWIASQNLIRVYVDSNCGLSDMDFDFLVIATRADIPTLKVEQRRLPR